MTFKDLREYVGRRSVDLPIDGRAYTVYDVDAETGLWAQQLWELGVAAAGGAEVDGADLDDESEAGMYARLLGDTLEEMREDGVAWSDIKHAAVTTLVWIVADEDTAAKYWESGVTGEAPAPGTGPNRATRRASSAAARKTRSRASTNGTKAPRSTSAAKATSRGKPSSPSGR